MNKEFKDFSSIEIEKESLKYRHNPEKQESFKDNAKALFEKGIKFTDAWNNAIKIARQAYGFKKINKTLSKVASDIVRDLANYKNNIIGMINSKTGTMQQKLESSLVEIYNLRTDTFLKKYENELLEFKGETKELKEWYKDFNDGILSKEEMNELLEKFKKVNHYYLSEQEDETYRARNDANLYFE